MTGLAEGQKKIFEVHVTKGIFAFVSITPIDDRKKIGQKILSKTNRYHL
jgi:hypothetical protein